tara:strand:+ start:876 stop:1661 length:786 start_codon:yes stop_codon:yes gene_type:complete
MAVVVKKGKEKRPLRICIYGADGSGKSTFPRHGLFLDMEGGLAEIDCQSIDLVDAPFADVMDAGRYVYKNHKELGIDTIVIDSIDWLERKIFNAACTDNGWSSIEQPGFGKGYVMVLKYWTEFLNMMDKLRELGLNIVLISHSQVEKFDDPIVDNSFHRHTLKINRHSRGLISEWVDVLGYVASEVLTSKTGDKFGTPEYKAITTNRRLIHFGEQPTFAAKSRMTLPESLPLDWEAFMSAVASARADQGNNPKKKQVKTGN